jgi:PAS domain-containing protein
MSGLDYRKKTMAWFRKNPVLPSFEGLLLAAKGLDNRFVSVNAEFAELAGLSPLEMIGKSDSDMPWADKAASYVHFENDILAGKQYSAIETLLRAENPHAETPENLRLLTVKSIIYENGQKAGVLIKAVVISSWIYNLIRHSRMQEEVTPDSLSEYSGFGLNCHESCVLFYFLKGFCSGCSGQLILATALDCK